ncbi:MAG: CBS domain-containing protein [Gemmatimonadota bacterium]|jgi:CBS domain-containing protein
MRLSELLIDDWIALPLEAADLQGALQHLVGLLHASGSTDREPGQKLARDLAFGSQGEVLRVNDDVVLVAGRLEDLDDVSLTLGVARTPFRVTAEGAAPPGSARAVLLLLTPRRIDGLQEQFIPALVRVLREEGTTARLLRAASPVEIRGLDELMATELRESLLVEDALTPLTYRIYPDTPLSEVVDLMVRRQLHAVPVVGENLEVLGIISAGDALEQLLPSQRGREPDGTEEGPGGLGTMAARDVMTRTVMCVAEDQSLYEAANLMVNRDVEQLPVVREGELIGFLTRQAILRRLFGPGGRGRGRPA